MKSGKGGQFPSLSSLALRTAAVLFFCAAITPSPAQPANDNFANRLVLSESSITVTGSLADATAEAGEPLYDGISSGQTAWWTWTAPSNGIVNMGFSGTGFNPFAAIYTGSNFASLTLVATNSYLSCYPDPECGCHLRPRVQLTFHAAQGEIYQISLDSALHTDATGSQFVLLPVNQPQPNTPTRATNVLAGGPLQFGLHLTPAPANDDLERAFRLSGSRAHTTASNRGATSETGEPQHLGNPGGSSVWYSWTAPASGRATISTNKIPPYRPPSWTGGLIMTEIRVGCGTEEDQSPPPDFYPLFAAYTGNTVDSLISANTYQLQLPDFSHGVAFDIIKGETYRIAFDGNQGTTGDVPLHLAITRPASNDSFKKRIATRGIYVVASGFNAGATREAGEPLATTNTHGQSVWWSWTAPVTGTTTIECDDLAGDRLFPLGVFTGNDVTNLNLLASGPGSTSFEAVAGQTYHIAVSDLNGITGAVVFRIEGPTIEAPLSSVTTKRNKALLSFTAPKGQKLLLQKSVNGVNWENVRTAVARSNGATFQVSPPPGQQGPYYRAVVVDQLP